MGSQLFLDHVSKNDNLDVSNLLHVRIVGENNITVGGKRKEASVMGDVKAFSRPLSIRSKTGLRFCVGRMFLNIIYKRCRIEKQTSYFLKNIIPYIEVITSTAFPVAHRIPFWSASPMSGRLHR